MKKWLYDFDVKKDVRKEVEEKSKNDKGEDVTVTTTVTEQEPFTFSIQKPTRKLYEEAELFYAVKLSEGIKAGLLTRPLLAKRYKTMVRFQKCCRLSLCVVDAANTCKWG